MHASFVWELRVQIPCPVYRLSQSLRPNQSCRPRGNISFQILCSVQSVLVELKHDEFFLHQLRAMELANNVRSMPGQQYRSAYALLKQAKKGFNGLTIRVDVDPDFPAHLLKPVLELLRMFHGPLNELSILGSPDAEQAQKKRRATSIAYNHRSL